MNSKLKSIQTLYHPLDNNFNKTRNAKNQTNAISRANANTQTNPNTKSNSNTNLPTWVLFCNRDNDKENEIFILGSFSSKQNAIEYAERYTREYMNNYLDDEVDEEDTKLYGNDDDYYDFNENDMIGKRIKGVNWNSKSRWGFDDKDLEEHGGDHLRWLRKEKNRREELAKKRQNETEIQRMEREKKREGRNKKLAEIRNNKKLLVDGWYNGYCSASEKYSVWDKIVSPSVPLRFAIQKTRFDPKKLIELETGY